MRKNSLKRIFAALALSAVATTSVTAISVSAEGEDTDTDTSVSDDADASEEETTAAEEETTASEEDTEEDTTAAEEDTTAAEEDTTAAEEDTTAAEEDTTAAEEDSASSATTVGPQSDGSFVYEDVDGSYVTLTADEISASSLKPAVTVSTVEGAAGAEVTITVSVSTPDWNATGIHVGYDTEHLTLVKAAWSDGVKDSDLGAKKIQEYAGGQFFTTAGDSAAGVTDYAVLTFQVTDAAQAGDFYPVSISYVAGDIFTSSTVDSATQRLATAYTFTQGITNGGVQIPAAEEETTVAATTTTAAATTTAKATTTVATTTVKATTTAPKGTTSSPKTGVAGVGVAAAGLVVAAGAAFVLRKKED